MDKDKLVELAERCEATTGADTLELINLECDICAALGIETGTHEAPFSASLDAAFSLVPDEVRCVLNISEDGITTAIVDGTQGCAATPALALCAAALRSHAQPK